MDQGEHLISIPNACRATVGDQQIPLRMRLGGNQLRISYQERRTFSAQDWDITDNAVNLTEQIKRGNAILKQLEVSNQNTSQSIIHLQEEVNKELQLPEVRIPQIVRLEQHRNYLGGAVLIIVMMVGVIAIVGCYYRCKYGGYLLNAVTNQRPYWFSQWRGGREDTRGPSRHEAIRMSDLAEPESPPIPPHASAIQPAVPPRTSSSVVRETATAPPARG